MMLRATGSTPAMMHGGEDDRTIADLTERFFPNVSSRASDDARAQPRPKPQPAELSRWAVAGISYFGIGYMLGGVAGVVTFIGAYIYCIATYGFLFGLGLGWLPSGILAGVVGWAMVVLWGPAIIFMLAGAVMLLLNVGISWFLVKLFAVAFAIFVGHLMVQDRPDS